MSFSSHHTTLTTILFFLLPRVYIGRAVFASCPQNLDRGCSGDPESVSVTAGHSAPFNATVVHIFGGSCGLLQNISNIELIKTNEQFVSSDITLRSCETQRDNTICTDSSSARVTLDRGNNPGFEFVFTLSNVTTSDAGMYKVDVTTKHPDTGSLLTISKSFTLQVGKDMHSVNSFMMLQQKLPSHSSSVNSSTHNQHDHTHSYYLWIYHYDYTDYYII